MVGAGSGVAPFPGFVAERAVSGAAGPSWLFFGNRHRKGDFLWQGRFETAVRAKALTRLDAAFSRDADDGAHVQTRLTEHAPELYDWLVGKKAVTYICGRGAMAESVRKAIADILVAQGGKAPAEAMNEVEDWIARGRIKIDAFD
jgi:sulfite reductase (NADPH) flavoprotein alpha-component